MLLIIWSYSFKILILSEDPFFQSVVFNQFNSKIFNTKKFISIFNSETKEYIEEWTVYAILLKLQLYASKLFVVGSILIKILL